MLQNYELRLVLLGSLALYLAILSDHSAVAQDKNQLKCGHI